jgi:hypothetical protein
MDPNIGKATIGKERTVTACKESLPTSRGPMSVGGCTDTPVHVDAAGNVDGKRPCLGNGQTVLIRTPTQAEFVECWSEAIIRNGLRTWMWASRRICGQ